MLKIDLISDHGLVAFSSKNQPSATRGKLDRTSMRVRARVYGCACYPAFGTCSLRSSLASHTYFSVCAIPRARKRGVPLRLLFNSL